jgi:hypothetical protein
MKLGTQNRGRTLHAAEEVDGTGADGDTIGRWQGSIRPRSAVWLAWSGVSMPMKAGA